MRHVPLRHGTILFAVQLNDSISSLWFLFIVNYLFLKKKKKLKQLGG